MGIEPEPEEDLSKVEWGAGFARLIERQYANLVFFCGLGWAILGCGTYLITGLHETELSKGTDIIFPIVLSAVLLLFSVFLFFRLRARVVLARAASSAQNLASLSDPYANGGAASNGSVRGQWLWSVSLGFGLHGNSSQRLVEGVAMACATIGIVGVGWACGMTTYCAYNKGGEPPPPVKMEAVYWQECYEFSRTFYNESYYRTPSHLPRGYFVTLVFALACAVLGPLLWFVLWKVVRQMVRPQRATRRTEDGLRELPQTAMFALAVSVGMIAGCGAWVFRQMIGIVHNIFFLQIHTLSTWDNATTPFAYDANQHTPPPDSGIPRALIILSPVIGGLIVAFLVKNWAPEAKGHGVPEVMDAIHYKRGRIRPSVAGVKILASSFSIGSGGSVGREGPIIQIGSTFGSIVGVASGCSVSQRVTLIACGAAGGIAATFNTPIGGIVFAVELMLPAANSRTLMPLGIAAVVATYIGRAALGLHPAFDIPTLQTPLSSVESLLGLLSFLPFGVIIGLVSVLFVKGIYWSEDLFDSMPGNYYTRHALGMLGQGTLMFLMMSFSGVHGGEGGDGNLGHYYIQGVGYATVRDVLSWVEPTMAGNGTVPDHMTSSISSPTFCLLLFLAKALSTGMTIGSGASGGIFSPSLYLGVTLGGAWGHVVYAALDFVKPLADPKATPFDPVQACVAGMAGMVGGSTGASITAITMTFEMTRDYKTILPIIITTVIAHMTRKAISEDSIYTLKLVRRGHVVPEGLQAAFYAAQRVQDVMSNSFRVLSSHEAMTRYEGVTLVRGAAGASTAPFSTSQGSCNAPLLSAAAPPGGGGPHDSVVDAVCGPVMFDHQVAFGKALSAAEYAHASGEAEQATCIVGPSDDLNDATRRMVRLDASLMLVSRVAPSPLGQVAAADVLGVVTKGDLARNFAAKTSLMARDRSLGQREASTGSGWRESE